MPTQALFVDIENIRARNFDVARFVDYFSKRGELVVKRAFGTQGQFAGLEEKLREVDVEIVSHEKYDFSLNRADIELIVNALEVAFLQPEIDTFIIASGDSDFVPLIRKLQAYKRRVVVVGRLASTSPLIRATCNEFINLSKFTPAIDAKVERGVPRKVMRKLYWANQINRECDAQLEAEVCGSSLSEKRSYLRLVSTLHLLYPGFSPRSFGFPKNSGIRKILQAIEQDGDCELTICRKSGEILVEFKNSFLVIPDKCQRPENYDKAISVVLRQERSNWRKQLAGGVISELQSASSRAHCDAV